MKTHKSIKNQKAFTLVESAVASMIILGVLGVAIPNYQTMLMKIKNKEAVNNLLLIYGAQKQFWREQGYTTKTGFFNLKFAKRWWQLDISNPIGRNYNYGLRSFSTQSCWGSTALRVVAYAQAKDKSYALYITPDAEVICQPCLSKTCSRLGYKPFRAPFSGVGIGGGGGGAGGGAGGC